jgi:hypothetical protein
MLPWQIVFFLTLNSPSSGAASKVGGPPLHDRNNPDSSLVVQGYVLILRDEAGISGFCAR